MNGLDQLLVDLLASLPDEVGDPSSGVLVRATNVELDLPIEAVVAVGGGVRASLPRGRIDSGFQNPLGRIRAKFDRGEAG